MTRLAPLVLVYDASCRFCVRQMDWIRAHDGLGCFEFVPSATVGLTERFPALAAQDMSTGLRAVRADGTAAAGADAVYEVALRLRGWRRLAWVYRVPGLHAILRWAYAFAAARRYRIAGQNRNSAAR